MKDESDTLKARTLKDYAIIGLKGMAMGAADVVPGVSGGTIAFITGIYHELLSSLKRCTPAALLIWKHEGFAALWRHVNGNFLAALFIGVLVSLKTFAGLVQSALDSTPVLVWSFFFGLIIASVVLLAKHLPRWRLIDVAAMLAGAIVVVLISLAAPAQLPGYWWIMFLGGFVAICAMILPGISGSFILLLVGLYPVFLSAVTNLEWVLLLSFGAGAIGGLLSFSRFLSWLLEQYHNITIATLIGFLVGSLNVTWPWKQTVSTMIDRHGETVVVQTANVLPGHYQSLVGSSPELLLAICCAIGGLVLVLSVEFFANKVGR